MLKNMEKVALCDDVVPADFTRIIQGDFTSIKQAHDWHNTNESFLNMLKNMRKYEISLL